MIKNSDLHEYMDINSGKSYAATVNAAIDCKNNAVHSELMKMY